MRIGRWGGINVYIHWTFWLLIAFYLISVTADQGLAAGLVAVAFVLSVFGCVALHEFGHAGAAAYFGIRTLDITLLPIGGVARLQSLPDKPWQELIIALAGPAVNFVIVGMLIPFVWLRHVLEGMSPDGVVRLSFAEQLLAANLILALFNLLPAFPMDGGRVLRSLLAMRMGHLRATEIAARAGRWMALFFGILGVLYFQFTLILLALFIFLAGTAELFAARFRALSQQPELDPMADLRGAAGFGNGDAQSRPWGQVQWHVRSWPTSYGSARNNSGQPVDYGPFGYGPAHYGPDDIRRDDEHIIDATEVRQLGNDPQTRRLN